jgi:enhancing lycopene biosynthesis protein 2
MTGLVRQSGARSVTAAPSSVSATNGNGVSGTDLTAVRSAVAESFDQGRQLLQFVAHAQRAHSDALKAWNGAADAAEQAIEKASGWGELMAAQNELMRDGLSRLIGTQFALMSSWFELQARLLQQAQHRAMDIPP